MKLGMVLIACAATAAAAGRPDARDDDALKKSIDDSLAVIAKHAGLSTEAKAELADHVKKAAAPGPDDSPRFSAEIKKIHPAYRKSLSQDFALLRDARKADNDQGRATIRQVAADLKVKAKRAEAVGELDLVAVKITTKKDGVEVGGYEVRYVPRALDGVPGEDFPFRKESSPTTKDLAPGIYLLWARKGTAVSAKTPQEIGDDGKPTADIDLAVP